MQFEDDLLLAQLRAMPHEMLIKYATTIIRNRDKLVEICQKQHGDISALMQAVLELEAENQALKTNCQLLSAKSVELPPFLGRGR